MKTIDAYQLKPLDGLTSGTVRPFDESDFDRLKGLGAVREATDDEVKAAPAYQNKMAPDALNKGGADHRDENGDTPGEAQLRTQFNGMYKLQGEQLLAAQAKADELTGKVNELEGQIAAKDAEITALKAGQSSSHAAGAYVVTDKSRGWWVIAQDGKEVTKSLREDDVKEFDKLSDADKLAFVDLHKVEA